LLRYSGGMHQESMYGCGSGLQPEKTLRS